MAGWINSTGTGSSGGRGAGGRGFPNRRYANSSDSGRWRGDRSRRGRPRYRYRPVDAAHRHSPPSSLSQQQAQAQLTHPSSSTAGMSPDDKASRNAANFECNVCFDLAAEPVVTKCGHLFCWDCLYQWLHVHSHHRECPVCKGQVADDAIIPIYGRGGSAASVDSAPPRPTGARVESSRQQQPPPPMVYMEDEDDDDDDPFDFPGMMNFGFGATSLSDAVMLEQYDDYSYEYDEVYGFPVFASAEAGDPSSDFINLRDSIATGAVYHSRGRNYRTRASEGHSSTDGMLMGARVAFYRDSSASSRPNGGWAERRGRSSRNSANSAGGRGMQDSRRHRTNYN